jgi:hypothetical protein
MPKEQFQREVEKELTGQETEAWEINYFKLYKSQIPVIEQALETAALMLGSDKSDLCGFFGRSAFERRRPRRAAACAVSLLLLSARQPAASISSNYQ